MEFPIRFTHALRFHQSGVVERPLDRHVIDAKQGSDSFHAQPRILFPDIQTSAEMTDVKRGFKQVENEFRVFDAGRPLPVRIAWVTKTAQ